MSLSIGYLEQLIAQWQPGCRAPTLIALAEFVNKEMPCFRANCEVAEVRLRRKIGRLEIPGRPRVGLQITIHELQHVPIRVFQYHAKTSYGGNISVVRWIVDRYHRMRGMEGVRRMIIDALDEEEDARVRHVATGAIASLFSSDLSEAEDYLRHAAEDQFGNKKVWTNVLKEFRAFKKSRLPLAA